MRGRSHDEAETLSGDIQDAIIAMRIDIADMKGMMNRIERGGGRAFVELEQMLATTNRIAERLDRIERRLADQ